MLLETIQKFNWVDILSVVIMLRALYVGLKRGFIDEVLHLLAVVLAIFGIFQYTPFCVHFLEKRIFFKSQIAQSVTFISLWALIALLAKFIRDAFHLLFKVEAKSFIDKAGGVAVGVVRGLLVCSLTLWFLIATGNEYIARTINSAYTSARVVKLAPDVYRGIFDIAVSKYFPDERMNQDVFAHTEGPSAPIQKQK